MIREQQLYRTTIDKPLLSVRSLATALMLGIGSGALAQTPVTSTSYIDLIDPSRSYPVTVETFYANPCVANTGNTLGTPVGVNCLAGAPDTPLSLTYTGLIRRVSELVAGGTSFYPVQVSPTDVVVYRNGSPFGGHDPDRIILLYDLAEADGA